MPSCPKSLRNTDMNDNETKYRTTILTQKMLQILILALVTLRKIAKYRYKNIEFKPIKKQFILKLLVKTTGFKLTRTIFSKATY